MIQVYLSTNTNFDKNGDMSLQPLSYEVSTAGINQAVEFTIEHEIDEYGRYEYLQKGNVIKAFTPWDLKKGQLFRIEDIDKDSKEGIIIASGYLIFYDNVKTYVKDFNNENVLICDTGNATGEEAIKKIFKNTNYIGHSNIMRISRSRLERKNIVAALTGDDENSFVNRWGGELFIDNFDIYMNEKIGHDTGLIISYGRNMEYIKESSSYKNTITRIIPIGFDGLRLTGKTPWVDSPNIDKYPYIMEKEIKFDHVKVKEENSDEGFETIEEARAELIRLSKLLFEEEQIDSPEVSIEVSMYDLQGTLEYESYECYEEVNLGDYIKARHEILNIDTLVRCIGYTWDGLALKYKTIKLGHRIDTYLDKQTDIYNKVNNILNSDGSVNAVEVAGILDAINVTMKGCRNVAQPLPVRVMICEDFDKDSPSYGAMCFGSMGFMIAAERTPDDKDWDWRTFGTGKGFFADLIVAGTMLADRIRGGVLQSIDGSLELDLRESSKGMQFKRNGKKAIDIAGTTIKFFDWDGEDDAVALIYSTRIRRDENKLGLAIANKKNRSISIAYEADDNFYSYMRFDMDNSDKTTNCPVTIFKETDFKGSQIWFGYGSNSIYKAKSDNLIANVKNGFIVLDRETAKSIALFKNGRTYFSKNDKVYCDLTPEYFAFFKEGKAYFWKDLNQDKIWCTYDFVADRDFHVNRNFTVSGTKNCIQATENYGERLFYSVEDCENYLTDRSMEVFNVEKTEEDTYERIILLDNIFKEAVRIDTDYTIEIFKQGWGDYRIKEQTKDYFIVEADREDFTFKYVVTAKRRGFEDKRLEEFFKPENYTDIKEKSNLSVEEFGGVAYEHEDN
ncbi:phage tail spike protein [uncultured Clostridium sp.]|mgnify:CR=1 FL=1|uniref:phage tail spike protein n=1 Tax=uncultured Clostridium sp. TaxID=59620 RepID=UPI0026730BEA|nr:phage tail spike protein [uncultured Clostridium sp.]